MVLNAANVDAQSIVQFLGANWNDPELVAKTATAYVLTVSDILDAYAQIYPGFNAADYVKTITDYMLQNNIPAVGGYIRPIGSFGPGQVTLRKFNPAYPSVVTILPAAQESPSTSITSAVPAIDALGPAVSTLTHDVIAGGQRILDSFASPAVPITGGPALPAIPDMISEPSKIPPWVWAAGGYLALKLLF